MHSVVAEDWELRIEKRGRLLHDWLKFSRKYHKCWREQEQKCYFEQLDWLPFRVYGANKNFLNHKLQRKQNFFSGPDVSESSVSDSLSTSTLAYVLP